MVLRHKKYNMADFIFIPLKVVPLPAAIRIADRILGALIPSFQIIISAKFIDTAIGIFTGGGSRSEVYLPLALLMATIVYQYISGVLMGFVGLKFNMKINEIFRVAVLEKRAKLEYLHIENNETWELVNRTCGNAERRVSGGFDIVLRMGDIVIRSLSVIMILFTQVWWAAIVIFTFSAPLFYIAIKSGKMEYDSSKEAAKHQRKASYLQGLIGGRDNVEERTLYSYTDHMNDEWFEKFEISRKIKLKTTAKTFVRVKGSGMTTVLIALLIVGVLISPLSGGAITLGMFMGLVTATFNMVQMVSWELTFLAKEIANNREYLKDLTAFSGLSESAGALALPDADISSAHNIAIEFKNVSFKYPGTEKYILKGLSLKLEPKVHYAFVGINGAGKTTITKLLTGLYDNFEGEITINGRNIREYAASELKAMFSVVYQDFARYHISLRENVALGDVLHDDDEKIANAVRSIELSDAIAKLPHGIDTNLGKIRPESVDISGGEWQRVAIARALVSNAPVYILDEPTAALDPIAESGIYEMFGKISEGRSTVFITHRLGAAKLADEIFVIEGGTVAEKGSHAELMSRSDGIYSKMFESQRSWYV